MQHGEFSLALDRVSSMHKEAVETGNAMPLVRTAVAIDEARSPLPQHQREHLLRVAVETVLETTLETQQIRDPDSGENGGENGGENPGIRGDSGSSGHMQALGALLESFDSYESSRLRTAMIDLGRILVQEAEEDRALEATRWRSALQRRGHALETELERRDGRPDGDGAAEAIALLRALGQTGDPAVSGLITRIRRQSRVREIVEAAREAQGMLRSSQ